MASSVTVQSSLTILQGNLQYRSSPAAFLPTMSGINGPTPGAIKVPTSGVDISFSQLDSMGGLGRFYNIDPTNFVTIGIRDKSTNEFYPFMDVLPGETYVMRLSSKLPKEELGTGTFSGSNAVIHAVANTAQVILVCEFFDP